MSDIVESRDERLDTLARRNAELRDEVERLRAALDDCIHGRKDWTEKARRALEPKP
jgi:hypothetical protein